jgi:hypothetical protein
MRTLSPSPRAFVDPATGAPAFGSYEGTLPRIELGSDFVDRVLRRKRWVWIALSTEEIWLSAAIVRMGYATSAFAFVFDLRAKRMLADETIVAPPPLAVVADDPHAPGTLARFGFGSRRLAIERRGEVNELRGRVGPLEIDATVDESAAPPPIAAVARLGPGLASATEKRALASARGTVTVAGRRFSVDGGLGGYDYTNGSMPRHTRWRWAFAMGRTRDGELVAFNVVEGFVGEAECAAFGRGRVLPIHEPRFDFDARNPTAPWRLRGDGVDLVFEVGAVHAQLTNLLLVRSRFLQPVGIFRGTIRAGGRDIELDGVPGVVEDQDVLW